MTYVSPTTGERVGLSFIIPRTREELEARREMMLHWARATCGMMGRSPDFMNVTLRRLGGRGRLLRAVPARSSAPTSARYHEHIREHDLTLTHALINLQRSRTVSGVLNLRGRHRAARGARDRRRHGRARRARAGHAGAASPTRSRSTRRAWPRWTSRTAPSRSTSPSRCGTPGLKFLCRESFDLGRSHFDHPLGSRFEEMDCVVFFDDVLVPWERVFLLGDVDLINGTGMTTGSSMHIGASGRGQEPGQVRVRPRRGAAHDADAGQRPPAAHRGAAGRADDVHGADARLHARRRGRRRARSVGRDVPGARCRSRSPATCS